MKNINVIGAGLAGAEAAWQAARAGACVTLYEMKPDKKSPAHSLDMFAELVCSNSLRAEALSNAAGLLKEELRILDSLIMECADKTRIPAGGALAVDRLEFASLITGKIKSCDNIKIIHKEVESLDEFKEDDIVIVATGPLTSEKLSLYCAELIGKDYLYFYDAAAPVITYDSIDMSKTYKASRYDKGDDDYINCPMNRDEYENFYNELINAETAPIKDFEEEKNFEGCMPVENMAKRGRDTIRFGPLKPVGLTDPKTGREPYAAVQLRQDNKEGTLYNLVGFQTHLKFPEQKRVFSLIPGLESAEFVRYGVMHRNTYINSPGILNKYYQMINKKNVFFAGQITGVEGYIESVSSGLAAGINAARLAAKLNFVDFPPSTAIGALADYISDHISGCGRKNFQPMNINYGIIKSNVTFNKNKKERYLKISEEAIKSIKEIKGNL